MGKKRKRTPEEREAFHRRTREIEEWLRDLDERIRRWREAQQPKPQA